MKIYLRINDEESGPFTRAEIFSLIKNGVIKADALARLEDQTEWIDVNKALASGALALFTSEQIAKKQEELPAVAVVIPQYSYSRKTVDDSVNRPVKSYKLIAFSALAIFVLICGIFSLARLSEKTDSRLYSEYIDHPASSEGANATEATPPSVSEPALAKAQVSDSSAPSLKNTTPSLPSREISSTDTASPVEVAKAPELPSQSQTEDEEAITLIQLPVSKEIPFAQMLTCNQVEKPRGALVICLDQSADAMAIAKNKNWRDFARGQNLAFAVVSFGLPKEKLADSEGYINADKGSGQLMMTGLAKAGWNKLPLFMFGAGNGGTFVSNVAHLPNVSVASWAAFTNKISEKFEPKSQCPVLVGCDYEFTKINPDLFNTFTRARAADLKWTWLTVTGQPNQRLERFQKFVQSYFGEILANGSKKGVWMEVNSLKEAAYSDLVLSPKSMTWLPSLALVEEWRLMMPSAEQQKDPTIVRKVVKTGIKNQPDIEMFLRLPPNYSKENPVAGTLAFCTWEENGDTIQKQLLYRTDMKQVADGPAGIVARLIRYAEKNNLAVLTWTTKVVWNNRMNTEELARKEREVADQNFNKLSIAWEKGIKYLADKMAIPDTEILLYGISKGAHWSQRLAVRKPERFLAVHLHIGGTYDPPSQAAASIMWLVTTGEFDGGYDRAIKFFREARQNNYSIIFKAVIGAGHNDVPVAENLGFRFFDYALEMQAMRKRLAEGANSLLSKRALGNSLPWKQNFEKPPYIGDFVNQEMYLNLEADIIPLSFRVNLPTDAIAQAWAKQ